MSTESEKKLAGMLAEFEKSHAKEGKNLRALLANTPELEQRMVDAIDKGSPGEDRAARVAEVQGCFRISFLTDRLSHFVVEERRMRRIPPRSSRGLRPLGYALLAALAGCTSSTPVTPLATATQESSMSAIAAPMTAEEIGRRVLKLIDSIHSAKDLSPEHIERETGIRVEFNATDRDVYGFGGNITDEWIYNLVSTPHKEGEKPTSLSFSFDDQTQGKADPAAICGLDFQAYRQALTSAGFDFKPMRGRQGVIDAWYFTRDDVNVLAYTHGNANPDEGKACISQLIISASA